MSTENAKTSYWSRKEELTQLIFLDLVHLHQLHNYMQRESCFLSMVHWLSWNLNANIKCDNSIQLNQRSGTESCNHFFKKSFIVSACLGHVEMNSLGTGLILSKSYATNGLPCQDYKAWSKEDMAKQDSVNETLFSNQKYPQRTAS